MSQIILSIFIMGRLSARLMVLYWDSRGWECQWFQGIMWGWSRSSLDPGWGVTTDASESDGLDLAGD